MLPLPLISTIPCLDYISFFMLAFHQPNVAGVHFISLRQLFCTTAIFLSITPFCSFCLFYSDHFHTFDLFCSFILSFRSVRFTHRFHHHCVHNFDQFLFKSILSPADQLVDPHCICVWISNSSSSPELVVFVPHVRKASVCLLFN